MLLRALAFDSSTVFNDYNSRMLYPLNPGNSFIQTGGPNGANYLSMQQYSKELGQSFKVIPAGIGGFFGVRSRVFANQELRMGVYHPFGQCHLSFEIAGNGQVTIYRCSNTNMEYQTTLLYTSPVAAVEVSGWHYIEFGFVIGAAGSYTFKIDGVVLTTASGVNTKGDNAPDEQVAAYNFYGCINIMDIYVADSTGPAPANTFFGDIRVVELVPTGPGTRTDFAPTGEPTDWQVAALSPPNPAGVYASSAVVDAADFYTLSALPAGLTTIFGVQVDGTMAKSDTGARTATTQVSSSGTVGTGAPHAMTLTPTTYSDVFPVDPATSAMFQPAGIATLQIGPRVLT